MSECDAEADEAPIIFLRAPRYPFTNGLYLFKCVDREMIICGEINSASQFFLADQEEEELVDSEGAVAS